MKQRLSCWIFWTLFHCWAQLTDTFIRDKAAILPYDKVHNLTQTELSDSGVEVLKIIFMRFKKEVQYLIDESN